MEKAHVLEELEELAASVEAAAVASTEVLFNKLRSSLEAKMFGGLCWDQAQQDGRRRGRQTDRQRQKDRHTHTHRNRETETETDTDTDTDTHTHTDTETHTHKGGQRGGGGAGAACSGGGGGGSAGAGSGAASARLPTKQKATPPAAEARRWPASVCVSECDQLVSA